MPPLPMIKKPLLASSTLIWEKLECSQKCPPANFSSRGTIPHCLIANEMSTIILFMVHVIASQKDWHSAPDTHFNVLALDCWAPRLELDLFVMWGVINLLALPTSTQTSFIAQMSLGRWYSTASFDGIRISIQWLREEKLENDGWYVTSQLHTDTIEETN